MKWEPIVNNSNGRPTKWLVLPSNQRSARNNVGSKFTRRPTKIPNVILSINYAVQASHRLGEARTEISAWLNLSCVWRGRSEKYSVCKYARYFHFLIWRHHRWESFVQTLIWREITTKMAHRKLKKPKLKEKIDFWKLKSKLWAEIKKGVRRWIKHKTVKSKIKREIKQVGLCMSSSAIMLKGGKELIGIFIS